MFQILNIDQYKISCDLNLQTEMKFEKDNKNQINIFKYNQFKNLY